MEEEIFGNISFVERQRIFVLLIRVKTRAMLSERVVGRYDEKLGGFLVNNAINIAQNGRRVEFVIRE